MLCIIVNMRNPNTIPTNISRLETGTVTFHSFFSAKEHYPLIIVLNMSDLEFKENIKLYLKDLTLESKLKSGPAPMSKES